MPLVCATTGVDDLGSDHAVARIFDRAEMAFRERAGEARPAGAAFKLGAGLEQRQSAQTAGVDAFPLLLQEQAAKGCLGAVLEQHLPLFVAEICSQGPQLVFGGWRQVEPSWGGLVHSMLP